MSIILAIETSCDETCAAIIQNNKLLSNIVSTQINIHNKYGGVVPEIASRLHVENINIVLEKTMQQAHIDFKDLNAVAVTVGPGLAGALHIGLQAAKTIALICNIPLIPVHHLAAHIYANEYIAKFQFPLLALIVSGGHTELVLMKDHLNFKIVGKTKDDAIGECFDKVARFLKLPYPGGVFIDQLAKKGRNIYHLPSPLPNDKYNFSYAGLKTAVINLLRNKQQKKHRIKKENICCSFEKTAINIVINKTINAAKYYNVKQIILAGGVSANSYLRDEMMKISKKQKINIVLPPLWCTTDNAAMVAKLAEHLYEQKKFASLNIGINSNWSIEDSKKYF